MDGVARAVVDILSRFYFPTRYRVEYAILHRSPGLRPENTGNCRIAVYFHARDFLAFVAEKNFGTSRDELNPVHVDRVVPGRDKPNGCHILNAIRRIGVWDRYLRPC